MTHSNDMPEIRRPGIGQYTVPSDLVLLDHDVLLLILESERDTISIDEIAAYLGLLYETIADSMRRLHDHGACGVRCLRDACEKCRPHSKV